MNRRVLNPVVAALTCAASLLVSIPAVAEPGQSVRIAKRDAVPAATSAAPRAAGLAGCTGLTTDPRSGEWLTAASRMLAGHPIDPNGPIANLAARPSVQEHRDKFTAEWGAFEGKRLRPIGNFHERELGPLESATGPLFYPFSGPDVAYALAFFPAVNDLVMTGLEPIGDVPDFNALDEATLDASLDQLRSSLRSILALSFFVTREMDSDLRRTKLSGVTPIMLLFLARHGYQVHTVQHLTLDADDRLCPVATDVMNEIRPKDARIPGVLVRFQRPGDARVRSLYYLRADLSDAGLARRPYYLRFVEFFKPQATLVKSASYLLHLKEFSILRDFILDRSRIVLQDDSGVPLKYYAAAGWERRLYGHYVGPIPVFKQRYQRDMNDAYQKASLPLGFGIGYRYESQQSNLQLLIRRPAEVIATGAQPSAPPHARPQIAR